MNRRADNLEGAACAKLPPESVDRYFGAHGNFDRTNANIAIKICRGCPVIRECLEQAINGPMPTGGVVGGVYQTNLKKLRTWRTYDLGLIDKEPSFPRPSLPYDEEDAQPNGALEAAEEYRRLADLSFEERVFEVFQGIKEQRITKLNEAIGKIGLIHAEFMVRDRTGDSSPAQKGVRR